MDGNLAVQTGKTGNRVLQLVDLHGDVMGTVPIADGAGEADWTGLKFQTADEFGNPTDLTTGSTRVSNGAPPGRDGRYGWLGGKQRSADALAGVLLMGVRLYDPATGRFWSTDPEPGGNGTAYDYCTGDPVKCVDLDGNSFWSNVKKSLKVIAKVAEVASFIPGPIGAAAAGISAAAYAATGNKRAAVFMAATVGAALVGAGAAVVAAKWGGAAGRIGRVAQASRAAVSKVATPVARAVAKATLPARSRIGVAIQDTRLLGTGSKLFGNSGLNEARRAGLLNQPGKVGRRLGWSVMPSKAADSGRAAVFRYRSSAGRKIDIFPGRAL